MDWKRIMSELKEEMNFRLLCDKLREDPCGSRMLWVEDILFVSVETPRPAKKPSLFGRIKQYLLGIRRSAFPLRENKRKKKER